ncbi:2-hydroxychromene-2-carboxylate isomerase [Tropicibacter sp. Alg240-R139]|uniref:2-hydroxychromene-2-carboxylate isomerase n=1 Tax=Tropicibacter sp. Alg240-R139 TaxID=2305991 RepID=UPI0019675C5C|nr:2-hydroxychromene-2-carboxylate isomerase [Tropicibacter sp. Alg240-R139]
MTKVIDFLYDFGSPNAYLVHKTLPDLAARFGASVNYLPVLLGGVFKATNNQSPMQAFGGVQGKLQYHARETQRFIKRHDLTFHMNPHFPVMTIGAMRGAIFAQGKDWESNYISAIFDAMWVHGQKMDDTAVIHEVLTENNLPAKEIIEATQDQSVKQGLIDATSAAVQRGVFGSPTMFVGIEMFFGKETLPEIEEALIA